MIQNAYRLLVIACVCATHLVWVGYLWMLVATNLDVSPSSFVGSRLSWVIARIVLVAVPPAALWCLVTGKVDPARRVAFVLTAELPLVGHLLVRSWMTADFHWQGELLLAGPLLLALTQGVGLLTKPPVARLGVGWAHVTSTFAIALFAPLGLLASGFGLYCAGVLLMMAGASLVGEHGTFMNLPLILALLVSLLTPTLVVVQTLMEGARGLRAASQTLGTRRARLGAAAAVALVATLLASYALHPRHTVLQRLASAPSSAAERNALLDDANGLRAGLLDIALAEARYFTSHQWPLPWPSPIHVVHTPELERIARARYRAFFGEELDQREAAVFRDSIRGNLSALGAFAGWIDVDAERVWLQSQHLDVRPVVGGVEVLLHDTWRNRVSTDTEISLAFTLPPNAAITGLWMGATPDRQAAFTYQVAPRGAAQRTYSAQVRAPIARDPALLEQVGPHQYRLRVYPIPPAAPLHVWLRYEVAAIAKGAIPFPQVLERRNAFWDADSQRTISLPGAATETIDATATADWVHAPQVPLTASTAPRARVDGRCLALGAAPPTIDLRGSTLDVIIDRSYPMNPHLPALISAIDALRATGANLEFVLTAGAVRGEPPTRRRSFQPADLLPFAASTPREMLVQWASLPRAGGPPRAAVLLGASKVVDPPAELTLTVPDVRLFALHFGGLPARYDDASADAITRSGGDVFDDSQLNNLLSALATDALVVHGHTLEQVPDVGCDGGLTGVFARLAIRDAARDRSGTPESRLAHFHDLAKQGSVVTAWSALIVLVNEAQFQQLRAAAASKDRFARSAEVDEKVIVSRDVLGVPEPRDWLLLLCIVALGAWVWLRARSVEIANP